MQKSKDERPRDVEVVGFRRRSGFPIQPYFFAGGQEPAVRVMQGKQGDNPPVLQIQPDNPDFIVFVLLQFLRWDANIDAFGTGGWF